MLIESPPTLSTDEVTERLLVIFKSSSYRPPRLPSVATELLALSHDPEVSFEKFESLLERDALLAGEVLGIARSAYYARGREVTSLRQALIRLGLKPLHNIVMMAAMNLRVFRCKAYGSYMARLQKHAHASAQLARMVAHYTPFPEEHVFLCGLLHDVGIAGILLALADVPRGRKPPPAEELWDAIGSAHAVAGARMIEMWNLPEDVKLAVEAHHDIGLSGFDHPVAATVCVADALAAELDMGLVPAAAAAAYRGRPGSDAPPPLDANSPEMLGRAQQALGLSDRQMEAVREEATEWAKAEAS